MYENDYIVAEHNLNLYWFNFSVGLNQSLNLKHAPLLLGCNFFGTTVTRQMAKMLLFFFFKHSKFDVL